MNKLARGNWFIRSLILVFGLFSTAVVHAAIIGTDVQSSMEIRYFDANSVPIVDATASDSGVTSASVSISGNVTGGSAYSNLGFSSLGAESATFDFDLGYSGGGYTGSGYLGGASAGNNATIEYTATSNFDMSVAWNFDYAGQNPFGLQVINLSGGPSETLGNFGQVGHHEGSTTYGLIAGNTYMFDVTFYPNVVGGIGGIDGSLSGAFDFSFDTASVPEPASLMLLMFGLTGLSLVRRKRT